MKMGKDLVINGTQWGFNRAACQDMEKAYLNKNPLALQYVKKNKSNLGISCVAF